MPSHSAQQSRDSASDANGGFTIFVATATILSAGIISAARETRLKVRGDGYAVAERVSNGKIQTLEAGANWGKALTHHNVHKINPSQQQYISITTALPLEKFGRLAVFSYLSLHTNIIPRDGSEKAAPGTFNFQVDLAFKYPELQHIGPLKKLMKEGSSADPEIAIKAACMKALEKVERALSTGEIEPDTGEIQNHLKKTLQNDYKLRDLAVGMCTVKHAEEKSGKERSDGGANIRDDSWESFAFAGTRR